MPITNVIQARAGRMQFQGLFETVVEIEALYDPPSINSNGFDQETIVAPAVRFGDFVLISFEADLLQLDLHGHVDGADSISVHLHNPTAGAVNLPEAHIHIVVLRPIHLHP